MTEIFKINNLKADYDKIEKAAAILKNSGTVVFPTETVYGLGANALDEHAVQKIFEAKGRPSDNPLIVHISDIEQVEELVSEIPSSFYLLAEVFWPGPLTMVMKKSPKVPKIVSAGLETVGIRMPDNPIALALIAETGVPVAAPSANVSGSPSPTAFEHVFKDLNGKVDVIIDGGSCRVGLESTVLDITATKPVVLRPGGVTPGQIEKIIGMVEVDRFVYNKIDTAHKPKSPGVKYRHYAPKAEVFLVQGAAEKAAEEINSRAENLQAQGKKVGILSTEQTKHFYNAGLVISAGDRGRPETIAASLFKNLRDFDEQGIEVIFIEAVDTEGIGMAIMNRMLRAAGFNVIKAE